MMTQSSRWFFAAAMIALGITGLVNADFALVWQQVPIDPSVERTTLAYACAIVELVAALGLLWKRTLTPACRVLFLFLAAWVVLLKVPDVVRSPLDTGAWGGIGEIAAMLAGAWCLFAAHAGSWEVRHLRFAAGADGIRAARWLLVLALPMLGAEVIVDSVKAGDHVMQPWLQVLPHPAAWAILTGTGSIAACLAMLFGVWPRLAATMEAAMVGVIAVAYWGPDLYTGRTATTAFIISVLVATGAWLVADTYRGLPWFATGRPVWRRDDQGTGASAPVPCVVSQDQEPSRSF